jgi:hypothetical protein
MASRSKSAVIKTQREIAQIEVKQSSDNTKESIRMKGITKGTHTNKLQKKPWKTIVRK